MDDMTNDANGDSTSDRDQELTSSGAAILRRAVDLADTDAALASLRARSLMAERSPAASSSDAASMAAAASMATAAAAAATSAAGSRSTPARSRSAVSTPPSRSRRRLRVGVSLAAAASIAVAVIVSGQHGNRPTVESSTPLQIAAVPVTSVTEPAASDVTSASDVTVTSPTLTPVTTTSRSCTYTDPAMRAISTARALTCPDGTRVFVKGVIVRNSDGDDWLCDEASGSGPQPSAAACLRLTGSPRAQAGGFLGVKQGDTLLDDAAAATLTPAPLPAPSIATIPTTVPITGPIFPPASNSPPTTASN